MRTLTFTKGHGTLNDFVVLRDRHNTVRLDPQDVRLICDRHAGIGADGLLRVVKAEYIEGWEGDPSLWFMDYRNADGSMAEMCGNGTRVFGRYLRDNDLVQGRHVQIATRAGVRGLVFHADQSITTQMGRFHLGDHVQVNLGASSWPGTAVEVGNPHAVVLLPPGGKVLELDLTSPPGWHPRTVFPAGANVEFVEVIDERHLAMRVFERGSGETLSCGTGVVASAAAHARAAGLGDGQVRVDVPGGVLLVDLHGDQADLTGPAELVAHGEIQLPD